MLLSDTARKLQESKRQQEIVNAIREARNEFLQAEDITWGVFGNANDGVVRGRIMRAATKAQSAAENLLETLRGPKDAPDVQDRASIYAAALREIMEPSVLWLDFQASAQRVARQALERAGEITVQI